MSGEPSAADARIADTRDRLSEVSRLATLLADQVLDAQITSRPVPDEHILSRRKITIMPSLNRLYEASQRAGAFLTPDKSRLDLLRIHKYNLEHSAINISNMGITKPA